MAISVVGATVGGSFLAWYIPITDGNPIRNLRRRRMLSVGNNR